MIEKKIVIYFEEKKFLPIMFVSKIEGTVIASKIQEL
jgi:hypothetical protein